MLSLYSRPPPVATFLNRKNWKKNKETKKILTRPTQGHFLEYMNSKNWKKNNK